MTDVGPAAMAAALDGFRRYLEEEVSPAEVAPHLTLLLAQPPESVIEWMAGWAEESHRGQRIPVRDSLRYALQKIYVVGELQLLDRARVADFLDAATTLAIRSCPFQDRELLRSGLTEMRGSGVIAAMRPEPPPETPDAEAKEVASKQLSLILDRIARDPSAKTGGAAEPQVAAQIVSMAANSAQSSEQFNAYVEQIRKVTGGKEGNVFVVLGDGLPAWDLPTAAIGVAPMPAQIAAMEKVFDLAETSAIALDRLRELVTAAIGKLNQGSIAATLWMLDVAQSGIEDKKLGEAEVQRIRTEAMEKIDSAQLRKYTENRSKHDALRMALDFFPAMRLDALMRQLRGEPRPERRRSLLSLIEIHGQPARALALAQLEQEQARPDLDTYYQRNTIYLLHRIPHEADGAADVERQLAAFTKATERGQNIYVIKEAATAIGQLKSDAAVKLLTTRLAELEIQLLRNDTSQYPIGEMQKLLDRLIAAIARIGSSAALLTVARHGMKTNPLLGDTRARLSSLAQHDLSFHEETVEQLVKSLRDELPGRLLSRLTTKNQEPTVQLIEALSGTRSPAVDTVLEEISTRFANQDIGRAATQAMGRRSGAAGAGRDSAATFAGELEFFGLPAVLQSLASMEASGVLTLTSKQGQASAKLAIGSGRFLDASRGHLRGCDALFEILERPLAGSFAFVPMPPEKVKSANPPQEILALIFEGVRRHDELQRMLALVPDSLIFSKGQVKPTTPPGETDPALVREVWMKASSGAGTATWQAEIPADSFRIRRLVSHWLESGALIAA